MQRNNRGIPLMLVILALGVAACGSRAAQPTIAPAATATQTTAAEAESPLPVPTAATDAESPLPLPTDTLAVADPPPAIEMTILRDEFAGLEIDFPVGWSLLAPSDDIKRESATYSYTLMSWSPQEPGAEGLPEGGSKIDLTVSASAAANVADAIASYRESLTQTELPVEVLSEEALDLTSGLSGMRFEIKTSQGVIVHNFVTSIHGHRILVSGVGDAALIDMMTRTLRAVD